MWELNHKEGWVLKNWCFRTVVLKKTLESPSDRKEIKLVHPKGNQPWIFIGRTDDEAEAPVFRPPNAKNWLIGRDPDAGEDWRQEEKGETEDEMVGWNHQLNRHEFEKIPGDGERQGSLACCSPWGGKEYDMTEWLNNEMKQIWNHTGKNKHIWSHFKCCLRGQLEWQWDPQGGSVYLLGHQKSRAKGRGNSYLELDGWPTSWTQK